MGGCRWVTLASVAALLILHAGAQGSQTRTDTGAIQDVTAMRFTSEVVHSGLDVQILRDQAAGDDGTVNESEAEAYLAGLQQAHNGSAASNLLWDSTAPVWRDLRVTGTNLAGAGGGKVTIVFDGTLLLNSTSSRLHTFSAQRPSNISNFTIEFAVPPEWKITNATGLVVTYLSDNAAGGWIQGTLATITIQEPEPEPPPSGNDTTPPVVNAGQDRIVIAGQLVSLNGTARDDDPQFDQTASYWWNFSYNETQLSLTGRNISFTFWALGEYAITFTAEDASENRASDTLYVDVHAPDEQDPTVDAGQNRTVVAGNSSTFIGEATDNDPDFPAGGGFRWSFEYNGENRTIPGKAFSFIFWIPGAYTLTFEAWDAWGNAGTDELVLTVVPPDTTPPVLSIEPIPLIELGVPATIVGVAADDDPAFPERALFWWTFTENGTPRNISGAVLHHTFLWLGNVTLTFHAADAWNNTASVAVEVFVERPDRQAPEVEAGADTSVEVGQVLPITAQATDNDPEFPANATLWWTVRRGDELLNVNYTGLQANFTFSTAGEYVVTFWARDAWGNTAFDTLAVTVVPAAPGPVEANGSALAALLGDPLLLLGLLALGGAGALGIVAFRRRSAGGALGQAAAAPAGPSKPPFVVEAVLILNRDGRLIHFQASGAEASIESPEVIGSMFTAVTEFIRDSFGKEGALSRLTYGQNTIVLERSRHLFGAVIVYGEPDAQLGEALTDVLRRLEVAYAGLVERWTGDREDFEGITGFVAPLIGLTAGLTRADVRAAAVDKTVRLGSGTEHYKGYIRLRVAMVNQTEAPVRDARVTVKFNQSVLRLARVEPAGLGLEGLTVVLGDIAPGERLGASYYLDPQTCSQTNIEGVGTYTDEAGETQSVKMKPRMAEIVCPLFFTPQHANPAMMRRLIETSLTARDSRLYRVRSLPPDFAFGDLFNTAREAVQRHHVVLVRNIKQKGPFEGNAWFYGQTKHSRSPVIIRVTVSENRRCVEFFGAVDSPATLTGMLAEFHRSFSQMVEARAPALALEPVLDDALKAVMSAEGLAEGAAEEGAPPADEGAV